MIRVAVVDDQELARDGFALILGAESDLDVIGTAADGAQAVDLARRSRPDVMLMDIRMPGIDGVAATATITANSDTTRVLILTTFELDEYVYAALHAGASGFLLKDTPRGQLVEAIRTVHRGDVVLAPQVTKRLIAEHLHRHSDPSIAADLGRLSPREHEVLLLVGHGLTNTEIAARLFLSEATVKTHITRIQSKIGLRDRVHAVIFAYESGLVHPGRS